jgi:threonine dehydratase
MINFVSFSAGFEVLDEIPEPDVIIVCCGGGGLLSGVSAAMAYSGKKTRVFGAEPEGGKINH